MLLRLKIGEQNKMTVIKPPFTEETARAKVKAAQDAWNTRDPDVVVKGYSVDSKWRNGTEFFSGHDAIKQFLKRKWSKELNYKLMKELWAFSGNKISEIGRASCREECRYRWKQNK